MSDADLSNLDENSIITKEDYFRVSRDRSLPSRCPLLSICGRRAETIRLYDHNYGDFSDDWRDEPPNYEVKTIQHPQYVGGGGNFYISNICPEVYLFERGNAYAGVSGYPTIRADYDKYWEVKYRILETGHYSECGEYSSRYKKSFNANESPALNRSRNNNFMITFFKVIASVLAIFASIATIVVLAYGDGLLK